MGIAELINKEKKTAFSFEVLPPLKGTGIEKLYATIDTLREFDPLYVNITTHRSEYVYRELGGGLYERNRYRRRPGTVAVAAAIHNKYDITVVPHILCSGFSREDTEYILLDLQFLGITNLLVLRGDKAKDESSFVPEKDGYAHALELEEQINAFNEGKFIDGTPIQAPLTPFRYGVAGYPEKHDEAPNMDIDLMFLKDKVDKGARYIVTQMFFDNQKYFDFVDRCRAIGITVPIIPGLKPIVIASQLTILPKVFHVDLPTDLATELLKCKDNVEAKQIGVEWCTMQAKELMDRGVPSIHFYSLNATESVRQVAKSIY